MCSPMRSASSRTAPSSPVTPRWRAAAKGASTPHIAKYLVCNAGEAGRSFYFGSLADIVATLARAEREGLLREKIRYFCRFALLIVDEIGYLPVIPGGGNLFFQLVNACHEKGAMILTSNRGFAEWGEIFGDPVATTLLDRLLHHAVVLQIEGSSYRLREHGDLLPEHIRTKANIQPAPSRRPCAGVVGAEKRRRRSLGRFRAPLTLIARTGELNGRIPAKLAARGQCLELTLALRLLRTALRTPPRRE
jgi:hypothetical protein